MNGTQAVSGNLSMQELADTLTKYEQLDFVRVTGLVADEKLPRNLVTFADESQRLGTITVCQADGGCEGTKLLATTAYVNGTKTAIELYRQPIAMNRQIHLVKQPER